MILYIQEENYHFDGFMSGVIADNVNNKVALFFKKGITENDIKITDDLKWYELDSIKIDAKNNIEIKAKNYALYKKFFCLNKIKIKSEAYL